MTTKSAPTLEQQRAQFAWDCAREGSTRSGDEYRNLAKAAPAFIMNNGLMQTLAFYQDKDKTHHKMLAEHLRRWVFCVAAAMVRTPASTPRWKSF